VGGQRHAPAALPPGKTRYPLYRRLGRPQDRSGQTRKISSPPGFDPRTVQPGIAQSLYRLSYPDPALYEVTQFNHYLVITAIVMTAWLGDLLQGQGHCRARDTLQGQGILYMARDTTQGQGYSTGPGILYRARDHLQCQGYSTEPGTLHKTRDVPQVQG